jgi:phenylacetic acid degradation operon negative regulatory protein
MVRQEDVERLPRQWAPWHPGQTASSARALLLTVLGEFVLPDGGRAWTSVLIEALSVLGIEAKTARQAIARTAGAGLLQSERSGRQVRWALTPAATRVLTEGAGRIYRFGLRPEEWDGRWLMVLASVPEANRHLRYRLRVGLEWQGFAALAPGVWICPWVEREGAAVAVLGDLGLAGDALSFRAEPGAVGDLAERVSSVWDLPALAREYAAFMETTGIRRPATPAESFLDLVSLVHDWRHFPAADPALPEPLLPAGWPGPAAARLFHDRHDRWHGPAWEWWRARAPVTAPASSVGMISADQGLSRGRRSYPERS